jgi:glycosyltransferase involved in cell wall biosynthesis
MRVLNLRVTKLDTSVKHWLFDFYPDLALTVLDFEQAKGTFQWLWGVTKQTINAFSIYRRYDLVLADNIAAILPLALIHSILHRRGPKFVGIDIAANRAGPNLIRVFRVAVKSMNAIICYTSAQTSWWIKNVGYTKVTFIHFGLGFPRDEYSHRSKTKIADSTQGNASGYIFSGGHADRDYRTLLRATSGLSERVVLAVGRDSVTGRTGLENVSLSNKVKIYHGHDPNRFLRLMSEAKLVVLAMQDVPYSVGQEVLLNAMSLGKPIIVTRIQGLVDYVEDGKTVLMVKPGDAAQLKQKIVLLLKNDRLRRTLGRNAKAKWKRQLTADIMRGKISGLLSSVMKDAS